MSYEGWAVLSLMGHNERYGYVREAEQYGTKMIRIDMPVAKDDADNDIMVTEYYGGPSIYSVRPVTEHLVRDHFKQSWNDPRPVSPLDYAPRRLIADVGEEFEGMET